MKNDKVKYYSFLLVFFLLLISATSFVSSDIFGNPYAGLSSGNIENYIRGSNYVCPSSGTVDSLTVYVSTTTKDHLMKTAIYDYNTNEIITNGESNEVDVLKNTEGWNVFTFSTSPTIEGGKTYILVVFSESDTGTAYVYRNTSTTQREFYEIATYPTFESPPDGGWDSNFSTISVSIYCTYTPDAWINTCPVSSGEIPSNKSTDIDINIGYWNVTINDVDGNNTWGNITCNNSNTVAWSNQANGTRSLTLDTLSYSTNYTVWLNFTDGHCDVNKSYWFITEDKPFVNYAPVLSNEYPSNNSINITLFPVLGITINDWEGDTMNITFYSNVSGTWEIIGTNLTNIGNGTYYQKFDEFGIYALTYYWNVSVTDVYNINDSGIFKFTAETTPTGDGDGDGEIGLLGIFGFLGFILYRRIQKNRGNK